MRPRSPHSPHHHPPPPHVRPQSHLVTILISSLAYLLVLGCFYASWTEQNIHKRYELIYPLGMQVNLLVRTCKS